MRSYKPIHYKGIKDQESRECFRLIDDTLRQLSKQISQPTTDVPANTTGSIVTSIQANLAGKRAGDIQFATSASISVSNLGNLFAHNLIGLPAALFGSATALTANSILTNGVAATASHSDHVHSIASAAHSAGYADAATTGTGDNFLRADGILVFPEALGTAANRAKSLTLTDAGAGSAGAIQGATLSAAAGFTDNILSLLAPNATNPLKIGIYGNLTIAGASEVDQTLMSFAKTDFNEATVGPIGINFSLTNSNIGDGAKLVQGLSASVIGTCGNAVAISTRPVIGCAISCGGGNSTNDYFTPTGVINYRATMGGISQKTIGTTVTAVTGFEAFPSAGIWVRVAVTDLYGFKCTNNPTLSLSASLTNNTGLRVDALTKGTNRYGVDIAAFTTGTPTVSYGVQVATHSVGTTRRSLIGGNTVECTANDFYCSTAAKGLLVKDAQGTPEYWRMYPSSDGTKGFTFTQDVDGYVSCTRTASPTGTISLNMQDTGTTAPAT